MMPKSNDWVLLPAMARRRNDIVTSQQAKLEQDAWKADITVTPMRQTIRKAS